MIVLAPTIFLFMCSQWAVKSFQLWDGELEFVDQCIDDDVRNNSAWNHVRFISFIFFRSYFMLILFSIFFFF